MAVMAVLLLLLARCKLYLILELIEQQHLGCDCLSADKQDNYYYYYSFSISKRDSPPTLISVKFYSFKLCLLWGYPVIWHMKQLQL